MASFSAVIEFRKKSSKPPIAQRIYTLSYTPKSHIEDASFRSVRVTVKGHPEWIVSTKSGYYAFGHRDDRDKQKRNSQ